MKTPPNPPKWADKLLQWLLPNHLQEFLIGDLHEYYAMRCSTKGRPVANFRYALDVLSTCKSFAFKKTLHFNLSIMIKYYFKLSWRNLIRQKTYSAIKIGGFALGIAATLLIALFVRDELSYDQHYRDQDQIYRLVCVAQAPEFTERWTTLAPPVRQVLLHDFPQIETAARIINFKFGNAGDNQFRPEESERNYYEKGFIYADPELLRILEIPLIYGNQAHALSEPNSVVISQSIADKYYPNEDPTGKRIILNESKEDAYVISGVMQDFPDNSHLHTNFLLTLSGKEFWNNEQTSWKSWNYTSYIKLKKGTEVKQMEENLLAIRDNYMVPDMKAAGDMDAENVQKYLSFELQPVSDIYLSQSGKVYDSLDHGDITTTWSFGGIALFILLLACINFINLSTAKSANRAKEVGLQKVMGSSRSELIRQYLAESVFYSLLSFIVAMILVIIVLPLFNTLANKSLYLNQLDWHIIPTLAAFILLVGLASGVYPSLYLSAFQPAKVLKGMATKGKSRSLLRGSLVVFQFVISIVLIICTIVTSQQMDYILHKDLGFEKDQVLLLQGTNTMHGQQRTFLNEIRNLPQVNNATITDFLPISGLKRNQNSFYKEGKTKEDQSISTQIWRVDENYVETMGMQILKGRNFSKTIASDSSALIINEAMAKKLGFENPIGQRIENGFEPPYHIIGIVEDFHFESLKGEITPLVLSRNGYGATIAVNIAPEEMSNAIRSIEALWTEFKPNEPLRHTFLNQRYAEMYDHVNRTSKVFIVFSVLAILIACMGLFALSAFMVEQRAKEISIRKVLGANMVQIFGLLTSNFMKLVAIAFILAIPIGWYLMRLWLSDYVYRVIIHWSVFLVAGILATAIALITISSESLKAGLFNPAQKLRSE